MISLSCSFLPRLARKALEDELDKMGLSQPAVPAGVEALEKAVSCKWLKTHWDWDKMNDISQTFSNKFSASWWDFYVFRCHKMLIAFQSEK